MTPDYSLIRVYVLAAVILITLCPRSSCSDPDYPVRVHVLAAVNSDYPVIVYVLATVTLITL